MNLLPREVAERLRTTVGSLATLRCTGGGPRFIKFGKKVLYPLAEIEAYERVHLRSAVSVKVDPDAA
jgi:hypothetical protein